VRESFKVSAPGKLMLLGEHAVLKGKKALVCAVNQRMSIICKKTSDRKINIFSSLGDFTTELDNIRIIPEFSFVLTTIARQKNKLATGFDLKIESDFAPDIGLGSSAAVTAATMTAVFVLSGQEINKPTIFDGCLRTIKKVQGSGSGADLAASIFGGILVYQMDPLSIEPLKPVFPISAVYSGSKTPTTTVIKIVEEKYKKNESLYSRIYDLMDQSVPYAKQYIESNDLKALGDIFNINQGLMDAIGVSNLTLSGINYELRRDPGIFGSKISGSGLGDCVVGIGKPEQPDFPYPVLPLEISSKGIIVE